MGVARPRRGAGEGGGGEHRQGGDEEPRAAEGGLEGVGFRT